MDSKKSCGASLKEFIELKNKYPKLKFVLDLQHAYEHDESMYFAKEFIKNMKDRITHFHVSGFDEKCSHAPVYSSDNRHAIEKILKMDINFPFILEGLIREDYVNIAKKEISYIRKF